VNWARRCCQNRSVLGVLVNGVGTIRIEMAAKHVENPERLMNSTAMKLKVAYSGATEG